MSVTVDQAIFLRQYSGYPDDPALPLGTWVGEGSVTGNGSGGSRQINFVFNPGSTSRHSLFYSLEELNVLDIDNAAKAGELRTVNMEVVQDVELSRHYAAPLVVGVSFALLDPAAHLALRRIFLGGEGVPGVGSFLRFLCSNQDLDTVLVVAGGYYWGPRSTNVPGGPSRPSNGIYPP